MASINHLLILGMTVLTVTQSYGFQFTDFYVYMTNHQKSVDHYVYLHYDIGPEAKYTNYETRYNGQVCYNFTNFVVENMGSLGNHRWLEMILADNCVTGRVIEEHIMTEGEPFSVCNVYWYNEYFDGPENPHICTPVMYRYHVIFTPSKDPDENVKQMIEQYIEDNNIGGLYRYDPSECDI